jgi:hypothetical protein
MSYPIFSGIKEVAVMPRQGAPTHEVLEIANVKHVGPVYVQLDDGRTFATIGGAGLLTTGCIVPVTDELRQAFEAKKHKAG